MTFVYGHNRIRWIMYALYTIVFLLFSYSCELQKFWSTFVYAGTYMLTYGKNASYWRIRLAYTNLCVWNTYHGVYELFGITLRFHLLQRWQHEIRFPTFHVKDWFLFYSLNFNQMAAVLHDRVLICVFPKTDTLLFSAKWHSPVYPLKHLLMMPL
jgi:hypothetical protein